MALIGCLFLCESCREETYIDQEPDVIIEGPSEIDYPVIIGKVKNKLDVLDQATIKVYQSETFLGEVKTNSDGEYSTAEIELDLDGFVTLEIFKEEHNVAYRRKQIDPNTVVVSRVDVGLILVEDTNGGGPELANPGSSNYFSLSGNVKDLNGNPNTAFIGLQYEYPAPGSTNLALWSWSAYPDVNGYFEFLLPKNVDMFLAVQDTFCAKYLTDFDKKIFSGLEAEAIGSFTSATVLPDFINPTTSVPEIDITGNFLDCNGIAALNGDFHVRLIEADGNDFTVITNFDDGNFSYYNDDCLEYPVEIIVHVYDLANNRSSDTLSMILNESELAWDLSNLMACNEGVAGLSSISLTSNGVESLFYDVKIMWEGADLVSDELSLSGGHFVIPNAALGDNSVIDFQIFNWFSGATFIGVHNAVNIHFTTLNADFGIGTIDGQFLDSSGSQVTATGTVNFVF